MNKVFQALGLCAVCCLSACGADAPERKPELDGDETATVRQELTTLSGTIAADTTIYGESAKSSHNYGGYRDLCVGQTSQTPPGTPPPPATQTTGARRALVRFTLPTKPANTKVVSATLRLYAIQRSSKATAAPSLEVHRMVDAWDEGTVGPAVSSGNGPCGGGGYGAPTTAPGTASWLNPKAGASWTATAFTGTATATTTPAATSGDVTWDVTADVQAFYSGTTNNGWAVTSPTTGITATRFAGRGYTDTTKIPRLDIVFGVDNGFSCTVATDCASNFCVDGVCCENACGSGSTSDCQACSNALTGQANGLCRAVKSGVSCRGAAGECDVAETCNGTSTACPGDVKKSAGTACTDDGLGCTTDQCDGTNALCQHGIKPNGTTCRAAVDSCDATETCNGTSTACPTDVKKANGTACPDESPANPCTVDKCNGTSTACQHTAGNAGAVCRPHAGECDVDDVCSGTSTTCGTDVKVAGGTACTDDGVTCTADQCDGSNNGCQHTALTSCVPWTGATQLEANTQGNGQEPQVAVNASGDGMVVWEQSDGTRYSIWARRYSRSASPSWFTATLIESDNTGDALYPKVAVDGNGNAIAVWQQYDGTRYNIMANRFTAAAGWGTAVSLESAAGTAGSASIAMDSSGHATAVWSQNETGGQRVWANRWSGSSWSGATSLDGTVMAVSTVPSVAMDPMGNALAVWIRRASTGPHLELWSARYTTAWNGAMVVDASADEVIQPQVALDATGNGVAVYTREDSSFINHLWAARFTANSFSPPTMKSGWAAGARIEPGSADASNGKVALNARGDGMAVWELVGTGPASIQTRRFSALSGWGVLKEFKDASASGMSPTVAVDGAGDAIVTWRLGGTTPHIASAQMDPVGNWLGPTDIEKKLTPQPAYAVSSPATALNDAGIGVAVWPQQDTSNAFNHVWGNTIQLPIAKVLVPQVLTVVECNNDLSTVNGACAVMTTGSSGWTWYRGGSVLAPNEVLHTGSVLVDPNGNISCVGCNCAPPGNTTEVRCPNGVISPGLINTHEHVNYSNNSPVTPPVVYKNRNEWRRGTNPLVYNAKTNDTTIIEAGELRQLMAGTTSLLAETGTPAFVRNLNLLDQNRMESIRMQPALISTFPLGDVVDGVYHPDCNFNNPHDDVNTVINQSAYLPHIGEGIDDNAHSEFLCVSAGGQNDLLFPQSTFVHQIATDANDALQFYYFHSSVTWSPRSNISLYGNTTPVTLFHAAAVPITLGTDWIVTGSMNLLRELKCADSFNGQNLNHYFSDFQLWQMVTTNAAFAAGAGNGLGMLKPGYLADLAIYDGSVNHDHRAVIGANLKDVLLVARAGKVLYGDATLISTLGTSCTVQDLAFDLCGAQKRLCSMNEVGVDFATLRTKVAQWYDLVQCGTPPGEPTCIPARPGEYPASTDDPDGDGLPTGTGTQPGDDRCPTIFSPIRPMDNNAQADVDHDNIGDACDVCPDFDCNPQNADDRDNDHAMNGVDNCPTTANENQVDSDSDGKGDACDPCPTIPNPGFALCPQSLTVVRNPAASGHAVNNQPISVQSLYVSALRPSSASTKGFYAQLIPPQDWGGIFVNTGTVMPSVTPGTRIDVLGWYSGLNGLGQILYPTITATGSGTINARPVAPADVAQGGALAEQCESMFVSIGNVTVINQNPDPTDFNEFVVTGGLRVDDELTPGLDNVNYPNNTTMTLQGVMTYSFSNHKLLPRSMADVTQVVLPP